MAGINHPEFARYQGSGYSNVMGWGSRPALLLVDVCKAYWTEGSPLDLRANPAAAAAPDSMRRLLTAARESGVPIIWTQGHYTSPTMADAGLFFLKAKMLDISLEGDKRGLNGWLEGLEPEAKEPLIKKQFPSAFFGTTLTSQLHLLNVDTLVICGVSTSGCVRASTLDAMCNGFRPMVVGAACGDRTPEIQNANLFDLNAKYADVVSEDEAVSKLKVGWV